MNNKKILHYTLFLLGLGLIAGFLLGLVNSFTAPVIEKRAKEEATKALREKYEYADFSLNVYADFENVDNAITEIYYAYNSDGNVAAVIYKTSTVGFNNSSPIIAFVEVKINGTFGKIVILQQSETTGIGDKILTHDFGITDSSIDNYNPTLIAGATYSSNAVVKALEVTAKHFKANKDKIGGNK